METLFADYLAILEGLHTDFKAALHDLPQEALDWIPGPETNSLAVLAVHTAGSERFWIGDVVAEETSNRVRESEFQTHGLDAQSLETRLDTSLEYIRKVLADLNLSHMEQIRTPPYRDSPLTCGWALMHALEHTAQHTAHAQLTRQLWDQAHH